MLFKIILSHLKKLFLQPNLSYLKMKTAAERLVIVTDVIFIIYTNCSAFRQRFALFWSTKKKSKFSFKLTSYSKNVTFLFALIKKFFVKATRFLQTDVTNKINGDEVISLQTGLP